MFWNYDGDWATRKVKLGYTPHFASYDIEQKVVTVACSREEKIEMLPKITAEGNKEYEAMPDIPNIGNHIPSGNPQAASRSWSGSRFLKSFQSWSSSELTGFGPWIPDPNLKPNPTQYFRVSIISSIFCRNV